jgi:tetratricopeptide (TPR) repeat protein
MARADQATSLLDQAWDEAAALMVQESYSAFSRALDQKIGDPREAQYGLALTLLNRQPKTNGNIALATDLFTRLQTSNPNDDIGISSLYFLARIAQVHEHEPDIAKALTIYEQLVREHPDHFLAQLAIVKISVLKLYTGANVEAKKKALRDIDKMTPLLMEPSLRCEFDYLVGTACIRYRLGDERAMQLLIEADSLGIPIQTAAANARVRIGNLALRLGRKDIAARYFERFIEDSPRDQRAFTIREILSQLHSEKAVAE